MIRIPSKLLRGKTEEQKATIIEAYQASLFILRIIKGELEDELVKSIKDSEDPQKYEIENWELWQSDNKGYRRALRKAIQFLPDPTMEEDDG